MLNARVMAAMLTLLGALSAPAVAQRLAVQELTVSDGLAGDYIQCVIQDRRGLLWIGTNSGLSRFDGSRFVSYSLDDGIPHSSVTCLVEDRRGRLWVGTPSGIARMLERRDASGRLFVPAVCGGGAVTSNVNQLALDENGDVWVVTAEAVLRADARGELSAVISRDRVMRDPALNESALEAIAFAPDRGIWLGTSHGLIRLLPGRRPTYYPVRDPNQFDHVREIMIDRQARVWIATVRGVYVLFPEPAGSARGFILSDRAVRVEAREGVIEPADGGHLPRRALPGSVRFLPTNGWVLDLVAGADGTVWAATVNGLIEVGPDRGSVRVFSQAHGLSDHRATAVGQDRGGVLWVGTQGSGLLRIDPHGMSSYGQAEGLGAEKPSSIVTGPEGGLVVVAHPPCSALYRLDGHRFSEVRIPTPKDLRVSGWGWNQVTFMDSAGEWWVPTEEGLLRFSRVERLEMLASSSPSRVYRAADGLGSDRVFRLWEDSHRNIWIGLFSAPGGPRLARWIRTEDRFIFHGEKDGLPFDTATAFLEAPGGAIWIGFYQGGVARYRDGRFVFIPPGQARDARAMPAGFVNDLLLDQRGRLWAATNQGLGRCDEPEAGDSELGWRCIDCGHSEGSSGDWEDSAIQSLGMVTALAEDRWGRIYAGTFNGVARLEPGSGRITRLDVSSGLGSNHVIAIREVGDGSLWFVTARGVSRLDPGPIDEPAPAPLWIAQVEIDGLPLDLPELGARQVQPVELTGRPQAVSISFSVPELAPGRRPFFSHSLDGSGWSEPSTDPRVMLVGLGAGRARLRARAVVAGRPGPASVIEIIVPPPMWQRWWFVCLVAAIAAGAVLLIHLVRARRLEALHRMRGRIASDLHDELGLSLTRISILSELARRQLEGASGQGHEGLARSERPERLRSGSGVVTDVEGVLLEIGESARELVDATGDMVWALDPKQDDLGSLIARVRRLATETLETEGIRFSLRAEDQVCRLQMGSERRRHLLLILKEAVNNAARHSGASILRLEISTRAGQLVVVIEDDGRGFDPGARVSAGRGLQSMAARAREIDAALTIDAEPGRGTRIVLEQLDSQPAGRFR